MNIGTAQDYAVLTDLGGEEFYYGYEVTDDEEWCFQAKLPDGRGGVRIVTIRQTQLMEAAGLRDGERCEEFLLAGIGLLIERGELGAKP